MTDYIKQLETRIEVLENLVRENSDELEIFYNSFEFVFQIRTDSIDDPHPAINVSLKVMGKAIDVGRVEYSYNVLTEIKNWSGWYAPLFPFVDLRYIILDLDKEKISKEIEQKDISIEQYFIDFFTDLLKIKQFKKTKSYLRHESDYY